MLVTLGDQDIDLSPTFTIFLSTRDPTVRAGHSGRPGHRPVAHIHHLPLHPGPHGTCWSPWETRTSTCRPHSPSSSPPGTPRYVLVTLGDQDIDLSPTFTIFLSTRDPTVRAGHSGRPGHRPVAHIHHLPLHPGPHGTCWSLWETRTSTCRPHSPSSSPPGTPRYVLVTLGDQDIDLSPTFTIFLSTRDPTVRAGHSGRPGHRPVAHIHHLPLHPGPHGTCWSLWETRTSTCRPHSPSSSPPGTPRYVLVTLGDQDIDLSPTFTIFLSTRDPTVRAGHSGRPGHRPVAHIHHRPLHPGPHGTCWSLWETRTSTCRPHSPSSSPPGTPRYVLVTLGDQDIDLSPTFTIFLSTRDPTVRAGHPGRPGHRPVAHILHHLPLHPGPHGTCWSLWETRTSTCRPHSPSSSPPGTPRYVLVTLGDQDIDLSPTFTIFLSTRDPTVRAGHSGRPGHRPVAHIHHLPLHPGPHGTCWSLWETRTSTCRPHSPSSSSPGTQRYVLVTLGDQDIDLSPTFTIVLSTRDPTVRAGHSGRPGHRPVAHIHHLPLHPGPHGTCWSLWETRTSTCRPHSPSSSPPGTPRYVLVTLGDQDIDLSPTFTIFLSTRDPTVRAGHSGRPGHRPVAHIHHLPLHPGPHGTCWSLWETRTSTCRPHSPSSSPPGTPRYVLVTLGDQDIDLSPTFTIFLSTRDPTVRAGHSGRPGHRPVAHIHHLPLHPGPHGTCWSLWETRTSTCRPHSPSSSPPGTPRYVLVTLGDQDIDLSPTFTIFLSTRDPTVRAGHSGRPGHRPVAHIHHLPLHPGPHGTCWSLWETRTSTCRPHSPSSSPPGTPRYVLVTLGDQDIDLSPTFTIFLSTRDPTVRAGHSGRPGHRPVAHIHHLPLHPGPHGTCWSLWETRTSTCRPHSPSSSPPGTPRYVLVTLGDQDIDLSPTFTIFLSTRDPTVRAGHPGRPGHRPVAHIHHLPLHPGPHGTC